MMTINAKFLEQNGQQASDMATLLANFISAAQSTLHLAIYDFRLGDSVAEPIVQALHQRAAAGVDVRIAYDAGKPHSHFPTAGTDPAPPGTADFVRRLGNGIQSKPISGGDPRLPKLMHHKYAIRDGRTPAGTVWTGSVNWTEDSWTLQENNLVQIASPDLCVYYETDFAELWQRGDIGTSGLHDTGTVRVEGSTVHVAFAPGEGRAIDHDVAHRISSARRRLRICSMLITSGPILGALSDLLGNGRSIEYGGIYDRTQMEGVFDQWKNSPAEWKLGVFDRIARPLTGKHSTPYTPGGRHDFMHNKVVVADDCVITGSYNLSHSASENAENILAIEDPGLAEQYIAYIDKLVQRYGVALEGSDAGR
jgi:phosphatidylserine/phosphatidylglycerophosphate/cardiolipin synthase-like enzyme